MPDRTASNTRIGGLRRSDGPLPLDVVGYCRVDETLAEAAVRLADRPAVVAGLDAIIARLAVS